MDEMNIGEMSVSELESKIAELKERLQDESLSPDERAQIEKMIEQMQSELDTKTSKASDAARNAAGLPSMM